MVDHRHVPQPQRPEKDVGPVEREVQGHANPRVVDVGREVDKVVRVGLLVHILLQELVGSQVRALLAHPEMGMHDIRHVGHSHSGVKVRFPDEKFGPGH